MNTKQILDEMKPTTHFWALCDGLLIVLAKQHDDYFSVCGDWECGYDSDDIDEVLQVIEVPKGYEKHGFVYFRAR